MKKIVFYHKLHIPSIKRNHHGILDIDKCPFFRLSDPVCFQGNPLLGVNLVLPGVVFYD